jgi:hypothetical protein
MNRKIKEIKEKTTKNKNVIKKEKKEKIEKKENIGKQNKKFNLLQGVDESTFSYNIRKSFVELLKPTNKKQFELYIMYSHVFNNIYFLKCRYQESTEEFINNFLKKYSKKFLYKISNL